MRVCGCAACERAVGDGTRDAQGKGGFRDCLEAARVGGGLARWSMHAHARHLLAQRVSQSLALFGISVWRHQDSLPCPITALPCPPAPWAAYEHAVKPSLHASATDEGSKRVPKQREFEPRNGRAGLRASTRQHRAAPSVGP